MAAAVRQSSADPIAAGAKRLVEIDYTQKFTVAELNEKVFTPLITRCKGLAGQAFAARGNLDKASACELDLKQFHVAFITQMELRDRFAVHLDSCEAAFEVSPLIQQAIIELQEALDYAAPYRLLDRVASEADGGAEVFAAAQRGIREINAAFKGLSAEQEHQQSRIRVICKSMMTVYLGIGISTESGHDRLPKASVFRAETARLAAVAEQAAKSRSAMSGEDAECRAKERDEEKARKAVEHQAAMAAASS